MINLFNLKGQKRVYKLWLLQCSLCRPRLNSYLIEILKRYLFISVQVDLTRWNSYLDLEIIGFQQA